MARITVGTGIWIDFTVTTVSQNISANSSVIRLNAKVVTNSSGWMNYSWTTSQIARVYINGSKVDNWDVGTQIGANKTRDLGTRQYNIVHNANGAKSISVKFEYQINANVSGGYKGTVSGTTAYTIKTIPRASSLTVQGITLPTKAITMNITSPAGSSAQNKLSLYINNVWKANITKWGSGSVSWSLTDDMVRDYVKTMGYGATYQIKVVCSTLVNNSNIGSATATNNMKNINKPTVTASKAKYNILVDESIKLTTGSYSSGMTYTTTTSTPTLGYIALDQKLNSTHVKSLIDKYLQLSKVNEAITCKIDIKYNNVSCRTETFTPASIYAGTEKFVSSVSNALVSFQADRDTTSWYPITFSAVEANEVGSHIMKLLKVNIAVPEASVSVGTTYIPKSAPVTIQASRMDLEKVAELDDNKNDFRYTVNARIYFTLYDIVVFEFVTSLLVLKRDMYEINSESKNTLGSIGTKVFNSKWESFSHKLNNLFYSKSPVPQFFYIPVLDKIPSWTLENELGEEVKSPLPTKALFDKVMQNGIDDKYTLTMMYLLCMFEGNRDTSYYKPNNYFKSEINATVVDKNKIVLNATGFPDTNYTGPDDITISKLYYHTNSGIPTFETSTGIKLSASIGTYKFEGIEEIRIIPINLEEFYDPSPAPEPPAIFDGTKSGDMVQPPVYYKKGTDGTYTEVKDNATTFYVVDNDKTETYGVSMRKYSNADTTIYYARQKDVLAGVYPASSKHSLDWYTDGKSGMAIRTPTEQTFTVRGYSGGTTDIRSGDILYITEVATGSYGLSGDIKGITKRFYECIYPVSLQTKTSYSSNAYWVIIDGLYKLILEQDIVGTKNYYDKVTAGVIPTQTPVYSSVKMLADTPPEYYTWDTSKVTTSILESDIQEGLYQVTVNNYVTPTNMEFTQYVQDESVVDKVVTLSEQDLLVYLKHDLPENDLTITVVQEDLFNKSTVTLNKSAPNPYLFMDTNLRSVGLLQYPTKEKSVEFPK